MPRRTERLPLPRVSPGTARELVVHRWGAPDARPKVYVQAAIHADEWPGLLVAHHLTRLLDEADAEGRIAGSVVMLPYANPAGMNQHVNDHVLGRFNLADGGGNYNRDWPDLTDTVAEAVSGTLGDDAETNVAAVRAALRDAVADLPEATETEAHRKTLLGLSIDADYVLDLHCDWEATLHLYANAAHETTVMELARDMGVPVVLIETDAGGGPFDEANAGPWYGVRARLDVAPERLPAACFATTVELRGQRDVTDELARPDAENLFRFLVRRGVVAGDAGPLPEPMGEPTPLEGVDTVKAPVAGIIAWKAALGERVENGQIVADIVDIAADDPAGARTPVAARTAGILFSQHVDRLIRPGATIGKIAGAEPLDYRKGGPLLSNR